MDACESQQQLYGDGLHQQSSTACDMQPENVRRRSVIVLETAGHPDTAV